MLQDKNVLLRIQAVATLYQRTGWYQRWSRDHELYGRPDPAITSPFSFIADRLRWGALGRYIWASRHVQGWTRREEAVALALASYELPRDAVVVEVGSFLGCSAILLAGARKLKGSGHVHCVDPFAATGDAFSVPIYQEIAKTVGMPLRRRFEQNLESAGLLDWVTVHQMTAVEAAARWSKPIDLLLLDGDQSREGANEAYLQWSQFLTRNGALVINASSEGPNEPGHDGLMRVIREHLRPPAYRGVRRVGGITLAIKETGYTMSIPASTQVSA